MIARLTEQDINKVYFRNLFTLQLDWNYEKVQGLGCAYVIMPALKRLYGGNPDKMKKALKMHLAYFDTTPTMFHLITGTDMVPEGEVDIESEEVVMSIKTGLMGPFAGVGDTLFIAIYRTVVFSTVAYIALEGNPVGPLIPLVAYAEVLWVRYKFTTIGYNSGRELATGSADKIAPITEAASILGLTVVGALIPSVIKYSTNLQFTFNEVTFTLQEVLDKILSCMLSLDIVVLPYWLLDKEEIDSAKLIFILIGLGMILGDFQNMLTFVAGLF